MHISVASYPILLSLFSNQSLELFFFFLVFFYLLMFSYIFMSIQMRSFVYSSLGQRAISHPLFGTMFGSPGYIAAEI